MNSFPTVCLGLILSVCSLALSSAAPPDSSASGKGSSKEKVNSEDVGGELETSQTAAESPKATRKKIRRATRLPSEQAEEPKSVPSKDRAERASNLDAGSEAVEELQRTESSKLTIGATAVVVESQSKLPFVARVDTGAASCSIHCEEWQISDEQEEMRDNIGREIRVRIDNGQSKSEWVDSHIDRCVTVKTSEKKETRYKVPFTFQWGSFEKEVVVTLNNRGHMHYPLLLGRNFLEGDFLVDIDLDERQ